MVEAMEISLLPRQISYGAQPRMHPKAEPTDKPGNARVMSMFRHRTILPRAFPK